MLVGSIGRKRRAAKGWKMSLNWTRTRISLWKERPNGIGSWKCQENDEVEGFLEKEGNVTTVSFHVKWKEIVSRATMTWVEVWGKGSIKRKERMMFPVNLIRFALILAMQSYSGRERSRSNQDLFPSVKNNRTVVVRKSFGGGLNTFCLHWQDSGENCHNLLSYSRRRVNAEVLAKWLIADPCATTTSTRDWRLLDQGIHMNSEWIVVGDSVAFRWNFVLVCCSAIRSSLCQYVCLSVSWEIAHELCIAAELLPNSQGYRSELWS